MPTDDPGVCLVNSYGYIHSMDDNGSPGVFLGDGRMSASNGYHNIFFLQADLVRGYSQGCNSDFPRPIK